MADWDFPDPTVLRVRKEDGTVLETPVLMETHTNPKIDEAIRKQLESGNYVQGSLLLDPKTVAIQGFKLSELIHPVPREVMEAMNRKTRGLNPRTSREVEISAFIQILLKYYSLSKVFNGQ